MHVKNANPLDPEEVVEDVDVFFFRHTFLLFFVVVSGVGDGSLDRRLCIFQSSHVGLAD